MTDDRDENDLTNEEVAAMWQESEPTEVAKHYQAHKDDPDVWSDEIRAPKRRSEQRRLTSMVSVRFTPSEVDELRRVSHAMGLSLSGYIRWLATRPPTQNLTNNAGTTVTIAGPFMIRYPEAS